MARYNDDLGSCGVFIKYTLFVINLAIFITCVVCVYISVQAINGNEAINDLLGPDFYTYKLSLMLFISAFIAVISCCGCYGALYENRCYLYFYFVMLFIFFILVVVGGVTMFLFRDKIHDNLKEYLLSTLELYEKDSKVTEMWNSIQKTLDCCGVESYKDVTHMVNLLKICGENILKPGCLSKVEGFVEQNAQVMTIGSAVIGVFSILGMIFTCALTSLV